MEGLAELPEQISLCTMENFPLISINIFYCRHFENKSRRYYGAHITNDIHGHPRVSWLQVIRTASRSEAQEGPQRQNSGMEQLPSAHEARVQCPALHKEKEKKKEREINNK